MRIPREVVEAVRDRSDIVEVVGTYVKLKRSGSSYVGLCPFHSEKTPSFSVSPDAQLFFCFGCEAGGDVITFIMRIENLDYADAVRFLAQRAGVTIPQDSDAAERGVSRRRVLEMNLAAARFFRDCLFDSQIGRDAMAYLTVRRGLSVPFIRRFGIGYAPDDSSMLITTLRRAGYSEEEMRAAFLCGVNRETGRIYDYFRDRVMFPVLDTTGHVVAFSGRDLGGRSQAKYLNSSDTPAFQKRKQLFGLRFAKNHADEGMILCEGNMDVVTLHASGFENAVASLGTALTPEQARLIVKYTKRVVIAYDSDEAGQRAARRAMALFAEVGAEVRILRMEGAKDPDEYIRRFGAPRFARLLREASTGFEFNLQTVLSKYDVNQPEGKIRAAADLCEIISRVYAASERDVYLHAASERLGLREDSLRNDVRRIMRRRAAENSREETRRARISAMALRDAVNPEAAQNVQAASAEAAAIGLLLLYDEHRQAVREGRVPLTAESFVTAFHRRAFERIMELEESDGGFSFALLGETFTPQEIGRLTRLAQQRRMLTENGEAVLRAAAETLAGERSRREAEKASPMEEIRFILEGKRRKKGEDEP